MKKIISLFIGVVWITFFLAACEGEQGPAGPTGPEGAAGQPAPSKIYFALEVSYYAQGHGGMSVEFAMVLLDELPSVSVNGVAIEQFTIINGIAEGSARIPRAETVTWVVSKGGQTMTGTLAKSVFPESVTCNGIELEPGSSDYQNIDEADQYLFSWSGGTYDYCYVSYSPANWEDPPAGPAIFYTFDEAITFTLGQILLGSFRLNTANGVAPLPGAVPNYTSSWADGFVIFHGELAVYLLRTTSSRESSKDLALSAHVSLADRFAEYVYWHGKQ